MDHKPELLEAYQYRHGNSIDDEEVICAECHKEFAISAKDFAKLDPSEYLCPTCVKILEHNEDVANRFEANYGQQDFQDDGDDR